MFERGAVQRLLVKPQLVNNTLDGMQHGAGYIIGVNLVAGHQEQRRNVFQPFCFLKFLIHPNQPVGRGMMGSSAGAMEYSIQSGFQGEARTVQDQMVSVKHPYSEYDWLLCYQP